ncbi:MAG: lipid-A-disaccharide synthase [Bdellovibrionales bacterium]|nr:lipid-A-disaccharide synthase [Bdellovibrionales bacterium]
MRILISAAEASSDLHGAELLKALRHAASDGETVDAFGVGGARLQAEGLRAVVDARDLLAMGFTEVLARLPRILRGLAGVTRAVTEDPPEIAVLIDYPEFHFRLARRLKRLGVPTVYYIPPKIWVWRASRLAFLRKHFRLVLCILPFEERLYRDGGLNARYVGNPLLDELPLGLTREKARAALGFRAGDRVLALLPGSRPGELERHFELMLDAADLAARQLGQSELHAPIPLPLTLDPREWEARLSGWNRKHPDTPLRPSLIKGRSWEVLRAADAGIVKSGTSTLEAALLGCPHVVIYRPSALTGLLFRWLVRYRGPVGLVNLLGGWRRGDRFFFEEVLMKDCTPARLAAEASRVLANEERRRTLADAIAELRARMGYGGGANGEIGPSARAALAILEELGRAREKRLEGGEVSP